MQLTNIFHLSLTSLRHLCLRHLPLTRTHFHFLPVEQGARSSALEQSAAIRAALPSTVAISETPEIIKLVVL